MLSLRWNQFENQSLSAPVRAHGLRRQVRQSLRSNRSNSKSHLSILLSVISKNKNEIEFRRECPPSLTARQHGGQRPPVGAPPGAPPAPPPVPHHCPTSLKPICFQAYHSTSAAPGPAPGGTSHAESKMESIRNQIPVCTSTRARSQAPSHAKSEIKSIKQHLPSFNSPLRYLKKQKRN